MTEYNFRNFAGIGSGAGVNAEFAAAFAGNWKFWRSSVLCVSFIRMVSQGEICWARQRAIQTWYGSMPASCRRLVFCDHRCSGSLLPTGSQMASRVLLRKLARIALGLRNRRVADDPADWSTHAWSPSIFIFSGLVEPKKGLLYSLITSRLWSEALLGAAALPAPLMQRP